MERLDSALDKILSAAEKYNRIHLSKIINKKNQLLENTLDGIKHVLTVHMFRGRRENLSREYSECLSQVIDDMCREGRLNLESEVDEAQIKELLKRYEETVNKTKNKKVNPNDKSMIKSYFKNVHPILSDFKYNPIPFIKDKIERQQTWRVYYFFTSRVKWSGQKLVGLLLRDIVDAYELRNRLKEHDLIYVFPVDTWVNQVTYILWEDKFVKKSKKLKTVEDLI